MFGRRRKGVRVASKIFLLNLLISVKRGNHRSVKNVTRYTKAE